MWLLLLTGILVVYLVLKVVQLYRADADLTVLGSNLKPQYFEGRVIWVTGASSGIGEEMCSQLSRMGAKLILSARNEEKLEQVKNRLANPNNARILPVDLSDPEATREAPDKAKNLFGKIDILVNNAGMSTRATFLEVQEHVHRQVMEINHFAPWILTHGTIEGMIEKGFGHIVNISSLAGKSGTPNRTAYCSAKFAIFGLMDSLRYEMLENNVHVTNIAPGPVFTDISKNALRGDGSKFGETDKMIANGMSVKRCVELTLIGVSNKQREVWVADQPFLMLPYLAHYCPSLLNYVVTKRTRSLLEASI